jgi:ethanolamine-phosphate cytidylyltransferase
MRIVKRTEGISTTDLVGRLLLMTKSHHITETASNVPLTLSPKPAKTNTLLKVPSSPSTTSPNSTSASSSGISNFLPTTWRLSLFSNGRTPTPEDKIVYIDGAFDLFHIGHIETLKKAKALGTFLYVGVHDDVTVNRHKGKNYPIMNLHERVMNVLSCRVVDEVVIGAPWNVTKDMVTTLNIRVVAGGSITKLDDSVVDDMNDGVKSPSDKLKFLSNDPYAAIRNLNIYQEIETSHFLRTSDVVERIINNRLKYEKRNEKRSAKEVAYLTNQKQFIAEL